jgi:16S rRNA (cytidine1402-2'-O)-methyltransferase
MPAGRLYLVPNLLGAVPPQNVLPAHTIDVARNLRHYVVENAKVARAFLKSLELTAPIQSIAMRELNAHTPEAEIETMLAPALAGDDLGLLSDAGCPGVADPGATLVSLAHTAGVRVVPLVGPSSILLALMASGLNGQGFTFHGYLPAKSEQRSTVLRRLEEQARRTGTTQIFIETPYRNPALLEAIVASGAKDLMLVVATDLTLGTEEVVGLPIAKWNGRDLSRYKDRPAIFLLGKMGSGSIRSPDSRHGR